MNTRPYLSMVGKENMFVCIGIIAVCYLSSLMNLIIDGGGSVRKEAMRIVDQYNNEGREDRISPSFLFFFLSLHLQIEYK